MLYPTGALTSRERDFLQELINQVDLRAAFPKDFGALNEILDYPSRLGKGARPLYMYNIYIQYMYMYM